MDNNTMCRVAHSVATPDGYSGDMWFDDDVEGNHSVWHHVIQFTNKVITGSSFEGRVEASANADRLIEAWRDSNVDRSDMHFDIKDIEARYDELKEDYAILEKTAEEDAEAEYDRGYEEGKDTGYSDGWDEGYDEGKAEGSDDDYGRGYDDGVETGREDGYEEGLAEGTCEQEAKVDELEMRVEDLKLEIEEYETEIETLKETIFGDTNPTKDDPCA